MMPELTILKSLVQKRRLRGVPKPWTDPDTCQDIRDLLDQAGFQQTDGEYQVTLTSTETEFIYHQ